MESPLSSRKMLAEAQIADRLREARDDRAARRVHRGQRVEAPANTSSALLVRLFRCVQVLTGAFA